MSEGTQVAKIEVTLDFHEMMKRTLAEHWGWFGDRPESFEEYCCMLVAEQLAEHVRMNEYRTSSVIDAVKRYMDDEGKALAEATARRAAQPSWQWGVGGMDEADPAAYYERAVRIHLDALAVQEARRISKEAEKSGDE